MSLTFTESKKKVFKDNPKNYCDFDVKTSIVNDTYDSIEIIPKDEGAFTSLKYSIQDYYEIRVTGNVPKYKFEIKISSASITFSNDLDGSLTF